MTEPPTEQTLEADDVAGVLTHGTLSIEGRLYAASNGTLLCVAELDGIELACVYKPVKGERPLWDFPDGTLGHREVAAARLATLFADVGNDAAPLVPPTIWRDDGPWGEGSCQLWIETADEALVDVVAPRDVPAGWRSVLRARDDNGSPLVLAHADTPELRRMALFDAVANNADRKGGHVLLGTDSSIYGVDHGLCFNADDKLRSVLWGWAGEPLTVNECQLLTDVKKLIATDHVLQAHLSDAEREITACRIDDLLTNGQMPIPSGEWPAIPWPAF